MKTLIDLLVDHMKATARDPGAIPTSVEARDILAHCLPPTDPRLVDPR